MHFLVLAAIPLSIYLLVTLFQGLRNPLKHVPGPWYTRWTSLVLQYEWLRGERAFYVQELHQKYGNVVRLGPNEVDFCSVAGAKRIHAYTRPLPKSSMYDTFSSGKGYDNVFGTRDLIVHARQRRLLSSAMTDASLQSMEHIIHEKAAMTMERIGLDMKNHGAANVLTWFIFFATDVIGELTFGDSFRMLEQGKMNQYGTDLQMVAERVCLRIAFPRLIKLASRIPLPLFSATANSVQRMRAYGEESIARYERLVAADPHNPKPTLFTKLFNDSGEKLTKLEIVANAQAYITAGSDTTAHTLTYLVWAVCRYTDVKARLMEELEALPDAYQDEDLKALPYLNQVIQETLRLYAAAPGLLPREVQPSGCEIDGYWMPKGTEVVTQAWSMHRNVEVYPEPERFNPSRWESPSKDMKDAWMPFGGGARVCIGMHLAHMELRIATAKFFRTYPNAKVSALDGFNDADMNQMVYFLMYPKKKRCLIQAS